MTLFHRIQLVLIFVSGLAVAAALTQRQFGDIPSRGDPDPSPLVISVAEWPTMFPSRSKTTGETMVPGIEIYSDGTTIIKRGGYEIATHIDAKSLRDLLAYLRDQHLFDLTEAKILDGIRRASPPPPPPTDQPKTILYAATGDQKVTISQYAFPFFAEKFPQVDSLQIMNRCIAKIYEVTNKP